MKTSGLTALHFRASLKAIRLLTASALVATALLIGGAGAVATIAPASAASKVQQCRAVSAGGQSYTITATNVSCSFAQKWVGKLAGKRLKAHAVRIQLSKGPSGYTCYGGTTTGSPIAGLGSKVQTGGSCRKGLLATDTTPYFSWTDQKI